MATIELERIRKSYGETVIVEELSLAPADGELVVLVGPSGCGKTTLLRIIAGLLEPTSGRVLIDGRDVTHLPPGERDIAMVFQSYALYPHMSVGENIAFPLRVRRMPATEITKRVGEVAEMLGLGQLLDRRPRDLSGGQRQRVAMGRAIVRQPKAFLFDEPLSNLDAALRARMRGEIAELHRRLGVTMIYVTHDQHEAMTLADRLVLLNGGRVEQMGQPLELYQRPATRFVGEFIGSPPMNFLPAERQEDALVGPAFRIPLNHLELNQQTPLPARLWLGIRPEALRVRGFDDNSPSIESDIDWIERTGSDGFLYARVRDIPVVVRIPAGAGKTLGPGQSVALTFNEAKLFDRDTGRAVQL